MIPTPRHQHVGPEGPFSAVYEPAEDTYLLLDALEQDAEALRSARIDICLEIQSHGIEAAWAGGKNGREVMDRLFPLVSDLLSARGLFYLVTIKENNPDEIIKILQECGLNGNKVISRQAGREYLSVLKFYKP